MSERTLSRQMATGIVDALKRDGHILLVKGGAEALTRELEAQMSEAMSRIAPRLQPRAVVGEVTSTFGDESVDEAVEDMVSSLAEGLMDSDHVEDVFAEDNVIKRDIFRVVRDTLLQPAAQLAAEEEEPAGPISVRLETLGYVASTVARRADDETLRDALERAALAAEGQLEAYDAKSREATFTVQGGDPDTRLEIEEAVADELSDLVDMGLVDLPTIERRIELPREVAPAERPLLRPRIDAAAAKTLIFAGCGASWEFAGPSAVKVVFTPLSEKDGKDVDQHASLFAREVTSLIGPAPAPAAPQPAPPSRRAPAPPSARPSPAPEEAPPAKPAAKKKPAAAAPKKKPAAAAKKAAAPAAKKKAAGPAAKKTAAKKRG